jgi:hypothetical protein
MEILAMKPLMSFRCGLGGSLMVVLVAATAQAGTMLSPVGVLGTDLGTFDPTVPLENMINQSSIDKPFVSGVTDFDEYFTTGAQPFGQGGPGNWQSDFTFNLPLTGFVDFDLGAVQTIERMAIWNRSLENVQILVSETLGGPMEVAGSYRLTNHLNFPFSYLPQILTLDDTFEARYLRIEIDSAYKFDVTDTFAYAIVGEVVVEAQSPALGLPGDFDLDQDVDGDDLAEWQSEFGLTAVGDADEDGDSDGNDFLIWQRQLGTTNATPTVAAVPEPTGVLLTLFAGIAGLLTRRREAIEPVRTGCRG